MRRLSDMESTVKSNLEEAANTAQGVATALLNGIDRIEDFAARLTTLSNQLKDLARVPGSVVLAGNPIDGMRIIGPWIDANTAGDEAREQIDDHWTVVELESPDSL